MASPAQCMANAENVKLSTGPKTEEGKAAPAGNDVRRGLFAAYERLAPEQSARINEFIEAMHAGFPQQCIQFEEVIREFCIAKWRTEIYNEMEASFFSSIVADELENPESAALVGQTGENQIFARALRRDSEGPKVFAKILRYGSSVMRDFRIAEAAFNRIIEVIQNRKQATQDLKNKAKPISQPLAATPRNAPCPCGSGEKYKRCCGVDAPAVLCAA